MRSRGLIIVQTIVLKHIMKTQMFVLQERWLTCEIKEPQTQHGTCLFREKIKYI